MTSELRQIRERTGTGRWVVAVLHRPQVRAVAIAGGHAGALARAQPGRDGVVAVCVADG